MTREQVIKGLESVRARLLEYERDTLGAMWIDDAIALLKEAEPMKKDDMYFCGECKNALAKTWRFCPKCGRKVKWE